MEHCGVFIYENSTLELSGHRLHLQRGMKWCPCVRNEIEIVPSDVSWLLWMKLIISLKDRMVFRWYLTNINVVCSCFNTSYAIKASETMPIGIMGSNSLTLHDWGSQYFSRKRKNEYSCLCYFLLSRCNTLTSLCFKQGTVNRHYSWYLSTLSRTLLCLGMTTFLDTAVYIWEVPSGKDVN